MSDSDDLNALLDVTQSVPYDYDEEEDTNTIQHTQPPSSVKSKTQQEEEDDRTRSLLISFLLMVIVGLGNKIFQVLQYIPMYNYALFVNMMTTFVYMPVSFAYIIPMIRYGTLITKEAQEVPKSKFAVMGTLDSLAGIMQSLAVNFIQNGSLVILLQQAAIPISMLISYWLLSKRYKWSQYNGAITVAIGLAVVLAPSVIHPSKKGNNIPLWSAVMIISCVPMCLSSVYKEKALGNTEIDAVYMNGWIAVFQFIVGLPLLLPAGPAADVPVKDIPKNLWNGARCLVGINSIMTGKHPDDCARSALYVGVYLCFNIGYNILILLILKFGSANILWLALTIMVPLGNVAFALDFMPKHKPLKWTDILGLILIMIGLLVYRFYATIEKKWRKLRTKRTYTELPETPDSPFLTSHNTKADDGLSTPGRGGIHTMKKAPSSTKEPKRPGHSSRAIGAHQRVHSYGSMPKRATP